MSSEYTVKKRILKKDAFTSYQSTFVPRGNPEYTESSVTRLLFAQEMVRSRGNVRNQSELRNSQEDRGGEFNHRRTDYTFSSSGRYFSQFKWVGNTYSSWGEQFYPYIRFPSWYGESTFAADYLRSTSDLAPWGTKAIALCSPVAPRAGIAQTLVELKREGLPSAKSSLFKQMLSDKKRLGKGVAGDYLNYSFGWVPLVSDVKKLAKSVLRLETYLHALHSYANHPLQRNFKFNTIVESTDVSYQDEYLYGMAFQTAKGETVVSRKTTEDKWFSGAFLYGYPMGKDVLSRMHAAAIDARYILGLELSPNLIWNVLPWSWLVDWFGNIGDVMSNISDVMYSQQVLKYGYVMRKRTIETNYNCRLISQSGGSLWSDMTTSDTTQQRVRASPYGFGLIWTGFSPFQISILTSLGLSNRRG